MQVLHRLHRSSVIGPTRVKINFGGKDASGYLAPFVPPILKGTRLEKEWLADMELIQEVYPQGTLVEVTEQGLFEDFVVKCESDKNVWQSAA